MVTARHWLRAKLWGVRLLSLIITPHINIPGLPAVTVPNGLYQSGSPFSVVFFGKKWSEATLLQLANAYEKSRQLS